MAVHDRTHLIVQRQTLDWAGPNYSNRAAAEEFEASRKGERNHPLEVAPTPEMAAAQTREAAEKESRISQTEELLDFWDSISSVSFAHCRRRLKEIAHSSWAQVLDCDHIYFDWTDTELLRYTSDAGCVLLFTDDDDWFAPDIFRRLEAEKLKKQSGWLWNRSRYDGTLLISPLGDPIFAFTNNYALLGDTLNGTTQLNDVMQHIEADGWITTEKIQVAMMDGACLSVTNKTPCSLTTLQRAARDATQRTALIEDIKRYAATNLVVDPALEWAVPFMKGTKSLFIEVRDNLRI